MTMFPSVRPGRTFWLGLLGLLTCTSAAAMAAASRSEAADPPFLANCRGTIQLGESRADGEVKYRFACSDAITSYAVVATNREIDAFDTEPVVLTAAGDPVPGESYTCEGLLPGWGITCLGKSSPWSQVNGAVNLADDPCSGARPQLGIIVGDSKGRMTGPFKLRATKAGQRGELTGCPVKRARKAGKRRHRHG
jgi:hypothetical protein